MDILNKDVTNEISEIGLVVLDNYGRLLVENKKNYIDIPRIVLKDNKSKDADMQKRYNNIFGKTSPYFHKLYSLIDYRYDEVSSQKIKIDYNYVITNDLPERDKYKFLTLNHINYLLDNLCNNKYIEYIKDELNELIAKLQELYKESIILSEFNKNNYLEHLTDSFITNNNYKMLKEKYSFLDINFIIKNTLKFIKNIKSFSTDKQKDFLLFQLEKVYPINSFLNNKSYSDIIVKISKDNQEYLVSTYLLDSYFNKDANIYLNDNEYRIGQIGIIKGLPQLIIYSKNLNMMKKVDEFEKIKKINYRSNYFKRY